METYPFQYYHLYNRTNNDELLFKEKKNYLYFLGKYRRYLAEFVDTHAYCLMPTHFHFLIYIKSEDIANFKRNLGILLSSYTKAINKKYGRHGSLFQQHTKMKIIYDESYLLTVMNYIHQNPVRHGLVERLEDWEFSSYPDLAGMRKGSLPKRDIIESRFGSVDEFKAFSEQLMKGIRGEYWV